MGQCLEVIQQRLFPEGRIGLFFDHFKLAGNKINDARFCYPTA